MNFIFIFLITSGVFAAGDNHLFQSDQFVITHYTVDSGLPLNSSNNVVQDHQGFLWISTYNGLVRFDGHQFTVFNAANTQAFPNNRITWIERSDLFPGIWLILETGGIIWYDYRDFHFYGREEGFTNSHVLIIRDHPAGFMIIGTDNGTFTYDGSGFERIYESGSAERDRAVDLQFDGDLVWISTNAEPVTYNVQNGDVGFPRVDGPSKAQTSSIGILPDSPPVLGYATGVFEYQNGRFVRNPRHRILQGLDIYDIKRQGNRLYISTVQGVFADDGQMVVKLESTTLSQNTFLSTIFEDSRGRVWMRFTGGELMRLEGDRLVPFDGDNNLQHLVVVSIFEDNEHTLWLGTLYGGLTRITDNPFRHIGTPEGLVFDNMLAIFEDSRGRFWMSIRDHGVQVFENGRLRSYQPKTGLVNEVIHTIAEDKDGAIWMGSHMAGVSIIHPDGRLENRNIGFVAGLNNVFAMFRSSDGSMWLGTADGVKVYRADGGTSHFRAADGLPANIVRYLTEAEDGSIWLATQGGGI